ncbi:MAG: hypothetical protein LBS60_02600 [Deltaproteobacteria bacterium]|jgi:hypothetical protein|nr:hypothetical protein [Deltaproteobacteria bacterium]
MYQNSHKTLDAEMKRISQVVNDMDLIDMRFAVMARNELITQVTAEVTAEVLVKVTAKNWAEVKENNVVEINQMMNQIAELNQRIAQIAKNRLALRA